MKKIKVMLVFGTRPEAIKMAPLALELKKHDEFETLVCVTAQHRQMLDQVMEIFNLKADYDLDIMKDRQTLIGITCRVLEGLKTHKAVTCGVWVKDTIKRVKENGEIAETLNRSELFAVQTPQGVWVKEYKSALEQTGDIAAYTDDVSIMESAGYTALGVEGSYKNIKITTKEDIALAQSYLEESL